MSVFIKVSTVLQLLRWKRNIGKVNLNTPIPVKNNPKFMTAFNAIDLIPDEAVVMSTGMTGTMRPAILYHAVRAHFQKTGHPQNITWITAGGAGGRGKVRGTVEEIAIPGLLKHFISGHLETARKILDMAHENQCELSVLPQGTITHLAEAQAKGEDSLLSKVGLGTFMDPSCGTGSLVEPGKGTQYVSVEGDQLRFSMPKVTAACIIGVSADKKGNIYQEGAPILAESREAARAARKNGGVVIATVTSIVPYNKDKIFLRADEVDAIVVNPENEMAMAVPQKKAWPALMPGHKGGLVKAMAKVNAINAITKLDPTRSPVDRMLARQTACIFKQVAHPGCGCIIGYGLPQEAGKVIQKAGLGDKVTFLVETGVFGGTPAPGIFFGMSFNPEKLLTSAEMFHYCEKNLDITILGMLQVDEEGNVNVSRKSDDVRQYIGPGGFQNLATSAKNILFVGKFSAREQLTLENGRLTLNKAGEAKFVKELTEVTFSAKAALDAGKNVFYLTPLGVFKLTRQGLELYMVAPGINVKKDILDNTEININLPEGEIPLYTREVMMGENFKLAWDETTRTQKAS